MGQVIEGSIPTLFGGVSRQPPQVRQPNQLEAQDNALSSVVTGGFEKRPATQFIADLTFLDNTKEYQTHGIDRSETEQDFILIDGSTPAIFAVNTITGAQKTVTIGDTKRYFVVENTSLGTGTGILEDSTGTDIEIALAFDSGETAFDWGWQLSDGSTGRFKVEGSIDGVTWNDIQTGIGGATSGTFSTTIGAVATGDHNYIRVTVTTGMASANDTVTLWATFQDMTYIRDANPEDLRMVSVADYTFILNRNVLMAMAEADAGTVTGTVQSFSDIPTASGSGNIYRIQGDDTDGFSTYYVQDDSTSTWVEIVDPTAHNNFDGSTMPHQLVRSADGASYTYNAASWDPRNAGDETVSPEPGFIGKAANGITFYKNRFVILADETVFLSQSGDVFNMWPSKATDVLDSDPIERAATTNEVNILHHGTTFRKLLFCTSSRAQFELKAANDGALKPDTAELSQATEYAASLIARPASMGNVLYFGSRVEGSAVVYEYFFEDTSFNNTASDVTRHIREYIKTDILWIDACPTTTTVALLNTAEQNALFIYRTFFDGNDKKQSAWMRYTFGETEANAFIHGFHIFCSFIVMVIERDDGNIYLEQFPIERETLVDDMPFMPLIDQRDELTGVYDAGNDWTTWTTTWDHDDDAVVVLGPNGAIPGRELDVSYPSATTVRATGDHSAGDAYVGRPYTMTVEISKLYPRQDGNVPITTGSLRLQDLTVLYEKTGYFELKITPESRDAFSYKFEGKELGSSETVVNQAPIISSGVFGHKKVMGNGSTAKIEFINDQPAPCVITSMQWRGFFNETGRQG